jgi:hypothetical protein
MATTTPKKQLDVFIDKFAPDVARIARAALTKVRKLTPGAIEIVYDNYNALAIGFSPTGRASDAILSVALYPRWVSVFFLQGAKLPDPKKRLRGSGSRVRHIVLEAARDLDEPAVRELIDLALSRTKVSLDPGQRRQLVIKSVSAKQRPRRPAP